jgi:hypothetical protein
MRLSSKNACDDLGDVFNSNYRQYLNGNNAAGIQAMENMAKRLQDSGSWLSLHARAHGLTMVHSRLYCLYENSGSNNIAKIHFTKCVYWSVIRAEAAGRSSEEIARFIDTFDHAKCRREVEAWDSQRRSSDR